MSEHRKERRDFLCALGKVALGTWMGLLEPGAAWAQAAFRREMDRRWWKGLPNGRVQCFLCPFG